MTADTGTVWTALGVVVAVMTGICTATVFVVRMVVQSSSTEILVKIAELKGRVDAINLAALTDEVAELRKWRHDFGQMKGVYDAYGVEIDELKASLVETRHALTSRITAIDLKLVRLEAVAERR